MVRRSGSSVSHPEGVMVPDLATNRFHPIPFLVAIYIPTDWTFYVTPMNEPSKKYYGDVVERPTSERYILFYRGKRAAKPFSNCIIIAKIATY